MVLSQNLKTMQCAKKEKYLKKDMRSSNYRCVEFVNLSMSSLGVFSYDCPMFLEMMSDIGIYKKQQHVVIKKKDKSSH